MEFETQKGKTITFKIKIDGADLSDLIFRFILDIGGVEVAFKGLATEDSVMFDIPPLSTVLNKDISGTLKARFEVIRGNFVVRPWVGEVTIKTYTKVQVEPTSLPGYVDREVIDVDLGDKDKKKDEEVVTTSPQLAYNKNKSVSKLLEVFSQFDNMFKNGRKKEIFTEIERSSHETIQKDDKEFGTVIESFMELKNDE